MSKYNKLVRDKIPEILDKKGIPYEEKRIAGDCEYRKELIKKLLEEAREFSDTPTIEELADILEVIMALQKLPEYSNVEEIRKDKREKRGGFEERIILKGEKK